MLDVFATISSGIVSFILFFNRNPKRNPPKEKNVVVSPADGKVKDIFTIKSLKEMFNANYESIEKIDRQGKLKIIPINLSIFDVHVIRSPCKAKVVDVIYQKGKRKPAIPSMLKESLSHNRRSIIVMKKDKVYFAVVQSAGIIARRVRSWVRPGMVVDIGQIIGRILFGSITTLVIPENKFKDTIKINTHVKAGESILGVFK